MRTFASPRCHVTLIARRERLRRPGHLVPELLREMQGRNVGCDVLDPDSEIVPLNSLDDHSATFYVLMSGSEAALSLAGAIEGGGGRLLTSYAAAAACRDKIVQTAVLARAGLPLPESWVCTTPQELAGELAAGPLLFKDPRGSRGRGIHLVRTLVELDSLTASTPWLVMRYREPEGPDMKLYRIGDEVHGVLRAFPAATLEEKRGRPLEVSPQLRELVMSCSEAFGTVVCGVDVIRSAGRLWVVDMSSFPGFKGVPGAAARIAELVLATAPSRRCA